MPRIFDNIEQQLLSALRDALGVSERADFCVGYFNLRGWKTIDAIIEAWPGGNGQQCRLLIGMQRLAQEDLRQFYSLLPHGEEMSNQMVIRLKRRLAADFRAQLAFGAPNNEDEAGLRLLSAQLKDYAAQVKDTLFDIKPLHHAIDDVYDAPLTEAARDLINHELRTGITDEKLVELVLALHDGDRLCIAKEDAQAREPQIICSLGIRKD
jgi:hypothetical protein